MKIRYDIALTLLTGVAFGATGIVALHAQAKPPTYVVIDISDVTDPEGFKAVTSSAAAAPARAAALGGRYIIRTQTTSALDGTPPTRFVVLAFDSSEKAHAWADAADVKEINAIRTKTTKSRAFFVDGLAN